MYNLKFDFEKEFYRISNKICKERNMTEADRPGLSRDFIRIYVPHRYMEKVNTNNINKDISKNIRDFIVKCYKEYNKDILSNGVEPFADENRELGLNLMSNNLYKTSISFLMPLFTSDYAGDIWEPLDKISPKKTIKFIQKLIGQVSDLSFKYASYKNNSLSQAKIMQKHITDIFEFLISKDQIMLGDLDYLKMLNPEAEDFSKGVGEYEITNIFHWDFLEYLTEYYIKLEHMIPVIEQEEGEKYLQFRQFDSQKIILPVFWLRVFSSLVKEIFGKPYNPIVATMVNILFETEYSEDDVANNNRKKSKKCKF